MTRFGYPLLLTACIGACHRQTEVRGIYVSHNGAGTFFPCDEPNSAIIVPDSVLAARSQEVGKAPNEAVYVDLRGIKTRSGSIYSGRRYFVVQQIVEVRARRAGECPQVAHPVSSVLPS